MSMAHSCGPFLSHGMYFILPVVVVVAVVIMVVVAAVDMDV